jgi:hypothetical protein
MILFDNSIGKLCFLFVFDLRCHMKIVSLNVKRNLVREKEDEERKRNREAKTMPSNGFFTLDNAFNQYINMIDSRFVM